MIRRLFRPAHNSLKRLYSSKPPVRSPPPLLSMSFPSVIPESVQKLRTLLGGAQDSHSWEGAWTAAITPWDKGYAQPALISTLKEEETSKLIPRQGRAIVPGMGRGYDVALLAKEGLEAVGVDISQTAVQAAKDWLASQPRDASHARASFVAADWFATQPSFSATPEEGTMQPFDVAYDYTFFCALPPALHHKWAAAYGRMIRPGGVLVALVYPIIGEKEGGPPFSVSPAQYKELLSDKFDLLHHARPKEGAPDRDGTEAIMIWRRKEAQ